MLGIRHNRPPLHIRLADLQQQAASSLTVGIRWKIERKINYFFRWQDEQAQVIIFSDSHLRQILRQYFEFFQPLPRPSVPGNGRTGRKKESDPRRRKSYCNSPHWRPAFSLRENGSMTPKTKADQFSGPTGGRDNPVWTK